MPLITAAFQIPFLCKTIATRKEWLNVAIK